MLKSITKHRLSAYELDPEEGGAMIIMAYLLILMFLYFTILMLDVPYMERIGRSMQRTLDAAALAGTIQLSVRDDEDWGAVPPTLAEAKSKQGWIKSKKAVFAFLQENPVAGAEALNFHFAGAQQPAGTGNIDSMDSSPYNRETYNIAGGSLTGTLTITRGVYHRPNNFSQGGSSGVPPVPITIFYRTENDTWGAIPPVTRWFNGPSGIMCRADTSPDSPIHQNPPGTEHLLEPTECLDDPTSIPGTNNTGQPLLKVADSVKVVLTIDNVPTLFAKLLGFNIFNAVTRTAISAPV